jgi:hypothetical protein
MRISSFARAVRLAVLLLAANAAMIVTGVANDSPGIVDSIAFGDAGSERSHSFSSTRSETIRGGLGEPARRLLPLQPESWEGGRVAFTLKIDPAKPNYATIRFWGSDKTQNLLILFCEGEQIGYRHLGDIDILDIGSGDPCFNGRFFYNTTPLPLDMTRGKTNLSFEIRCVGPTWGYASTFDKYQKPMTEPTRGIYALYTHTDGFFVPPAGEQQGSVPQNPSVRKEPGPEVLDQLKERVNRELNNFLSSEKPLNQMQVQFLARAYLVKWTSAYQNKKTIERALASLDAIFVAYRKDPRLAESDPATPNADWFGLGPSGDVIRLLAEPLKPFLDQEIDDGMGKKITRRAAFPEMLVACRDWHRRHRRLYTNQSMINDLYGIYLANRGVAVVDPSKAVPENEIRRYLYESVGLEPWRDSDPGGEAAVETRGRGWNVGTNYWQLTAKGLTKELGYVGYYGEVLDWVTTIYDATRPAPDQPGGEKIRAQLVRMEHARGIFRYPALDTDGNRAMRIEAVVGWRDGGHYPGDIAYGERTSWDGSALYSVSATLDPESIGFAQQMFRDNQFFALIRERMKESGLRVTAGLLGVPDQYELIKSQPQSNYRLPMSPGQPDFVFTDEEDGVVALKNGDDILYVSLYWRARNAVNSLARVHYTTPRVDRIAVVREEVEFEPSGMTYTRPDHINFGFGNGGPKYPVEMHSAHAGEQLPIAKIPDGVRFRPGDESVYAGKGDFYALRYGDYLIGQNITKDRTFELKAPGSLEEARELVSGKTVKLDAPLKVGPRSTVVLRLKQEAK